MSSCSDDDEALDGDCEIRVDHWSNPPSPEKALKQRAAESASSSSESENESPQPRKGKKKPTKKKAPAPPRGNHAATTLNAARRGSPSASELQAARAAAAASVNTPATETTTTTHGSKKASPPGSTTARRPQKKKKQAAIRVKGRVHATRSKIFHLHRMNPEQKKFVEDRDAKNNFRLFGTVVAGRGSVDFDVFPHNNRRVSGLDRRRLIAVGKDEEEVQRRDDDDDFATIEKAAKKPSPEKISIKNFIELGEDVIADADHFDYACGEEPHQFIKWLVLPDGVHVTEAEDPMVCPTELESKVVVECEPDACADIFFKHFFPDVTGHGKRMDEHCESVDAPFCQTCQHEKMKFHDEDAEDPYWIIKQCHLLMIAAVTEADVGIANLWKTGKTCGRRLQADFGQCTPVNWFRAFCSACPFMWCDTKWWHKAKRDLDWDVFKPCLKNMMDKRKQLFVAVLIVLDESMFAWKPKSSKTDGAPNLTFEPRKPVDLGTQIRDAVECLAGVIICGDILELPEVQRQKKHFCCDPDNSTRAITSMPREEEMPAHTAEVLRQVEES